MDRVWKEFQQMWKACVAVALLQALAFCLVHLELNSGKFAWVAIGLVGLLTPAFILCFILGDDCGYSVFWGLIALLILGVVIDFPTENALKYVWDSSFGEATVLVGIIASWVLTPWFIWNHLWKGEVRKVNLIALIITSCPFALLGVFMGSLTWLYRRAH